MHTTISRLPGVLALVLALMVPLLAAAPALGATAPVTYGPLAEGTYRDLVIRVEFLKSDGSGGTSANIGFRDALGTTDLTIDCPEVPPASGLTASKDATPSIDRIYEWATRSAGRTRRPAD